MATLMAPLEPKEDVIRRNMKAFREECGLSRAELAEISGIPEKNIGRYENGETGVPATVISDLARIFARDEGDFYKTTPPPAPKPEQRPRLFLKTWPGVEVPRDVLDEVREAIESANEKLRGTKLGRK